MVAAGSGSRLGHPIPKALVELGGVPLVRRCLDALAGAGVTHAVVTVPAEWAADFVDAIADAPMQVRAVVGGARRQDSVRLGALALAEDFDDAVVLVHDAARPLVPSDVVARVAAAVAGGSDAVVPAVPVVDSIRQVRAVGSRVVDRSELRAIQTPQGFRLGTLLEAHERVRELDLEVTDDAAAAEAVGLEVDLVDGHRDALKITEPVDLVLATAILDGRSRP